MDREDNPLITIFWFVLVLGCLGALIAAYEHFGLYGMISAVLEVVAIFSCAFAWSPEHETLKRRFLSVGIGFVGAFLIGLSAYVFWQMGVYRSLWFLHLPIAVVLAAATIYAGRRMFPEPKPPSDKEMRRIGAELEERKAALQKQINRYKHRIDSLKSLNYIAPTGKLSSFLEGREMLLPHGAIFEGTFFDPKPVTIPLKELYSSVLVFGATGSGKTSASGNAISETLIKAGAGGLVLCEKEKEPDDWIKRLRELGVPKERIILLDHEVTRDDCTTVTQSDFLVYEMKRPSSNPGDAENMVHMLKIIGRLRDGKSVKNESNNNENAFFENTALELLRAILIFMKITMDNIDYQTVLDFVKQMEWGEKSRFSEDQKQRSILNRVMKHMKFNHDPETGELIEAINVKGRVLSKAEYRDLNSVISVLAEEIPTLAHRTRSSVISHANEVLAPLRFEKIRDVFASGRTEVYPEMAFDGKIIILGMTQQTYGQAGRIVQAVWKFIFQKAVERRKEDSKNRPVFLWVDEAQKFVNDFDQSFLTTVRSKNCVTVFLTQNINNLREEIGVQATQSMLGNFKTKIFHRNDCWDTNEEAAKLIGKYWHKQRNVSETRSRTEGKSYTHSMNDSHGWNVGDAANYGYLNFLPGNNGAKLDHGSAVKVSVRPV